MQINNSFFDVSVQKIGKYKEITTVYIKQINAILPSLLTPSSFNIVVKFHALQ